MSDPEIKRLIGLLAGGATLDDMAMEGALARISAGLATPAQMGAFLMALRLRGETVAELTGAARMMRAKMTTVMAPPGAVDIVGTGGDAQGTYNVSTYACFVGRGRRAHRRQARQPLGLPRCPEPPTCSPRLGSASRSAQDGRARHT